MTCFVESSAQMMTMCGDADGMVSGATHTTAATIRPGLQVLRTKDSPLVSSVFFMCLPDKVWAHSLPPCVLLKPCKGHSRLLNP